MTDSVGKIRAKWESLTLADKRLCGILADAVSPVGAARAHRALRAEGLEVSQATVSRSLDRLDRAGLTTKQGRTGRVLTEFGVALVVNAQRKARRDNLIDGLSELEDRQELIELLEVRKSVECQAVALVIARVTQADHRALLEAVAQYDENSKSSGNYSTHAVQFHVAFCQAAHSKPYDIIADALVPEMGRLEPLTAAAARAAGESTVSQEQHKAILGAIISGDADNCHILVKRHFDSMIAWLQNADEDELRAWMAEVN